MIKGNQRPEKGSNAPDGGDGSGWGGQVCQISWEVFLRLLSFFTNFWGIHSICIVRLHYSKYFPGGNFCFRRLNDEYNLDLAPKTGCREDLYQFWDTNRV